MKYSNSRRTNRAYASSAAKLDAVERRFARLFDAISYAHPIIKLRLWIAGLSGDSVVAPAPSAVIEAVVSKAMGGLVDWGGGVTDIQCPDRFEIQVPVSAWRIYYGHGTAEICTRIEGAVQAKLHRKLGCDLSPRVTICPTMALLDDELIVQSFYFDTLDEQADVHDEAAGNAAVAAGNAAAGANPESVFSGKAVVEDVAEAGATPVIGTAPEAGTATMAERDVLEAPSLTPCLMTEAPPWHPGVRSQALSAPRWHDGWRQARRRFRPGGYHAAVFRGLLPGVPQARAPCLRYGAGDMALRAAGFQRHHGGARRADRGYARAG